MITFCHSYDLVCHNYYVIEIVNLYVIIMIYKSMMAEMCFQATGFQMIVFELLVRVSCLLDHKHLTSDIYSNIADTQNKNAHRDCSVYGHELVR